MPEAKGVPTRSFDLAALDMAGTTIEEHGLVYVALRAAVESHTRRAVPDDVFARWTGTSKREAVEGLLRDLGTHSGHGVADAVHADFHRRLTRAYAATPPTPLPGVTEAIATLRAAGVKVVLQTGYSCDVAESILAAVGWQVGRDVDGMVPSDEVPASRPAPFLVQRAMELAGVTDPGRVLVAGDTPNDLLAGTRAGAGFVVGVLTGAHDEVTLRSQPHTHLLAGAHELVSLL